MGQRIIHKNSGEFMKATTGSEKLIFAKLIGIVSFEQNPSS